MTMAPADGSSTRPPLRAPGGPAAGAEGEWGDLADLAACPRCDAVYRVALPRPGERAVCGRCHHVLMTPRKGAGKQIIGLSISVLILISAAACFPFLSISAAGLSSSTSVLGAALAFRGDGILALLSLALAALIVFIPALRAALTIYVLAPIVRDRPAAPHANLAFRLSESLRPWSMAEIFAIGCAVALVKVAGLAHVGFGPAFWIFAILVVLVILQDTLMCPYSVWRALDSETAVDRPPRPKERRKDRADQLRRTPETEQGT
ncbi:paraquat-inducible protein A [Pseudooceanicola algae]|uniref:Intermembrane transport protein YebS n=1 Tax=Pseudooceanicola algae TaxID=1537215 RepID=A0A418SAT7_9RHOB|nr:paraquat-inducible protein A [Pseudooceanicola algae]QPM91237.1 Intermembrane transport protein YebS [Pseudooceanicola algae]